MLPSARLVIYRLCFVFFFFFTISCASRVDISTWSRPLMNTVPLSLLAFPDVYILFFFCFIRFFVLFCFVSSTRTLVSHVCFLDLIRKMNMNYVQ